MNEISVVLRRCSWCDINFTRNEEEMRSNKAIDQSNTPANKLSLSDDHDNRNDIIEARF